jgi:hypothetical protein
MNRTVYKTARTHTEYRTVANGYELVIPAGSPVSNSTACGNDDSYRFLNGTAALAKAVTGFEHSILEHDLRYSGLNIPAEFCEPYVQPAQPVRQAPRGVKFTRPGFTAGTWNVSPRDTAVVLTDARRQTATNPIVAECPGYHVERQANAMAVSALPDAYLALEGLLLDPYLSDPINTDRMAPVVAAMTKAGYVFE